MRRLQKRWMVSLAAGVCALTVLLLGLAWNQAGIETFALHLLAVVPLLGMAIMLLTLGSGVRRLRRGERTRMTVLGAARTATWAQAGILTGAILTGAILGRALLFAFYLHADYIRAQFWVSLAVVVAAAILWTVSTVVEGWCVIDRDDSGENNPSESPGRNPSAPAPA